MSFLFALCLLLHSFCTHASTTEKAANSNSQLHVRMSDIRQKLINSETYYTKLTKSIPLWPQFTCLNATFKKGDKDPAISVVRKQLILLKIIKNKAATDEHLFDEALEAGIQTFQQSHCLDSDGIIGQQTCLQLNITPNARTKAIQQSILQFDTLMPHWGTRYIIVNLPTFGLLAVNNDLIELRK